MLPAVLHEITTPSAGVVTGGGGGFECRGAIGLPRHHPRLLSLSLAAVVALCVMVGSSSRLGSPFHRQCRRYPLSRLWFRWPGLFAAAVTLPTFVSVAGRYGGLMPSPSMPRSPSLATLADLCAMLTALSCPSSPSPPLPPSLATAYGDYIVLLAIPPPAIIFPSAVAVTCSCGGVVCCGAAGLPSPSPSPPVASCVAAVAGVCVVVCPLSRYGPPPRRWRGRWPLRRRCDWLSPPTSTLSFGGAVGGGCGGFHVVIGSSAGIPRSFAVTVDGRCGSVVYGPASHPFHTISLFSAGAVSGRCGKRLCGAAGGPPPRSCCAPLALWLATEDALSSVLMVVPLHVHPPLRGRRSH